MFSAVKSALLLDAAMQHAVVSALGRSANAFEQVLQQRHAEGQGRSIVDDPWVWPEEVNNWNDDKVVAHVVFQNLDRITIGCNHWTGLFWPQVSFLTQEVRRRMQVLPDEVSPAKQVELRSFAKKASFLICADVMDARKGTEFSEPVMQLWEQLEAAPATSLAMPDINASAFFQAHKENIRAFAACEEWNQALMCDLGYNAEKITGKMHSSAKCWNTVQRPQFYKNPADLFEFNLTSEGDAYLACQEHPLAHEFIHALCPYYGHYEKGYHGQEYWGQAPSAGSVEYEDIMKCNHKFGIPDPALSYSYTGLDRWYQTWDHVGF